MKYFSMFSGIGGFELGIEKGTRNSKFGKKRRKEKPNQKTRLGFSCAGYSEIDKYAIQIYEKHFPHKNYGDATAINPDALPDFDMLCGGFPCQSFSIAGKRGGFQDTRGTLFFDIARIARAKRPKLLFLENVKGLLSHDKGKTFGTILATLSDMGYVCEWQVCNSKNFGVPQNRERVFIIGHFGGISRRAVFPIGKANESNFALEKPAKSITPSLTAREAGEYHGGMILLKTNTKLGYDKTINGDGIRLQFEKSKSARGRVIKGRSQALQTSGRVGTMQGNRIRRLTPTECERLQGFPDGWTEGISDSQRYKCLGNAVTVNVIETIANKLSRT